MKSSGFLWCVPGNSCPDQLTSLCLCICQEGHHDGARWLPCSPGYNCSLCSGSMYIQPLTVALQVEAAPALQLDQTQNLSHPCFVFLSKPTSDSLANYLDSTFQAISRTCLLFPTSPAIIPHHIIAKASLTVSLGLPRAYSQLQQ